MKYFKNNWLFLVIGGISLLMGVLAVLTALKLRQETALAPTVPKNEFASEPICRRTVRFHVGSPIPFPSAEVFSIPAGQLATGSGQVASLGAQTKSAADVSKFEVKASSSASDKARE